MCIYTYTQASCKIMSKILMLEFSWLFVAVIKWSLCFCNYVFAPVSAPGTFCVFVGTFCVFVGTFGVLWVHLATRLPHAWACIFFIRPFSSFVFDQIIVCRCQILIFPDGREHAKTGTFHNSTAARGAEHTSLRLPPAPARVLGGMSVCVCVCVCLCVCNL